MANPIGRLLRNRRAGHSTLAWAAADLQAPENFVLRSPAFEQNAPIPRQFRGRLFAPNVSPALEWTAPPTATQELVLIVQDPDAPGRVAATHCLAAGLDPSSLGIAEGSLTNPSPLADVRFGKGPLGRLGWLGPAPIPSHGPHSYVFQLFALDRPTRLESKFTLAELARAMAGHVIGRARLDGTYEID